MFQDNIDSYIEVYLYSVCINILYCASLLILVFKFDIYTLTFNVVLTALL